MIGLEITDSMLSEPSVRHVQLDRFHATGIQIALDDVDAGQSPLIFVKRFALDSLKNHRTFVCDVTAGPNDDAIIEAIVVMVHTRNFTVGLEGVETPGQE